MIASFFKTSKPFHFITMSFVTLLLFIWYRKEAFINDVSTLNITIEIFVFLVVLFSLAILTFITSKNNLTQKNSYHILLFVLLLALIPETIKNNQIAVSNVFVLLAFRRLISLKSFLTVKKKLFDAALWIGIASLFYFWSILFFALIFIALIIFSIDQFRNWIIPFLALATIFVLATCYYIITEDSLFYIEDLLQTTSLDFSVFNSLNHIIGITLLLSLILWTLFYYIVKLRETSRVKRSTFVLVFYYLLIALVLVAITNNKSGSEFLFLFAPFAIIASNYIESIEGTWFSEIFVLLIFIASGAVLLL